MAVFTSLAKFILPLLVIWSVFAVFLQMFSNGFDKMLDNAFASKQLVGSRETMITTWTGFEPVDKFLCLFLNFFYPIFDGKHPTLSLFTLQLSGQFIGTWILLIVESFRVGNAWRAVSFVTLWGLGAEFLGAAIVFPFYGFIHLLTSPTAQAPSTTNRAMRKATLLIHPTELRVLPWSVAIGLGVPVFLAFYLPVAATGQFWESAQFWILARVFHPLWTAIVHLFLSMASRANGTAFVSATQRNRDVLRALHGVYTFATCIAVVTHVATVTLSATSYIFPSIFSLEYQAAFHPVTLYRPVYVWQKPTAQVASGGAGAFDFLQWDAFGIVVGTLIWAIALNRQALSRETQASSFLSLVLKTVLLTVVGGPVTAAISLIRERDHVVLDLTDPIEQGERKSK